MKDSRPSIVFIFIDCLGGIPSFYWNLINHSSLIKSFRSSVILLKSDDDVRPRFLDEFAVDKKHYFNYSITESQYHVQFRLNDLIGDEPGLVVTDNGLPIQACVRFGNPKTICHLVHDYYYVNQNIQHAEQIDFTLAHSSFFSDAVFASNPFLNYGRTFYIPYGVKAAEKPIEKNNRVLKLVFLGRLDKGKGVQELFKIDDKLKAENISVHWTIIGKGPLKETLVEQWKGKQSVEFHEPVSTADVYKLLKEQDIFVFPTLFEGTPVSILECLANGVVTITHDLPGGIRDILKEGIGYRCSVNDLDEFVSHLRRLHTDRDLLKTMQTNCLLLFETNYNIVKNADLYFQAFLRYKEFKRAGKKPISKLAFLDRGFLPNFFVRFLRRLR